MKHYILRAIDPIWANRFLQAELNMPDIDSARLRLKKDDPLWLRGMETISIKDTDEPQSPPGKIDMYVVDKDGNRTKNS